MRIYFHLFKTDAPTQRFKVSLRQKGAGALRDWRMLYLLVSVILLSGCGFFRFRQPTPTSVAQDAALARFLDVAPVLEKVVVTPTSTVDANAFWRRKGIPLPLIDPLEVVGNLTFIGSPSLAPLTHTLYNRFISDGYRDTIRIEEISSDAAFPLYCGQNSADRTAVDILMADRAIRQSELDACRQNNRLPIALRVAIDAVVVVTHVENDFVTSVTKTELAILFTKARRWSDVRQSWPNREILHVVPTTRDTASTLFIDKILHHDELLLRNAPAVTFLEDGGEIAFMVTETPNAVGFLNFIDYLRNPTNLRLIAIDGIPVNEYTVSSGAYALSYPLLLYTDVETLARRPQVGAFLLYYLAYVNEIPIEVTGNFPISETAYERSKRVLLIALGQESYLEQFAPTSTPAPPPTLTPTVTPPVVLTTAVTATAVLTTTVTVTR